MVSDSKMSNPKGVSQRKEKILEISPPGWEYYTLSGAFWSKEKKILSEHRVGGFVCIWEEKINCWRNKAGREKRIHPASISSLVLLYLDLSSVLLRWGE